MWSRNELSSLAEVSLYLSITATCPVQPNMENSWGHQSQWSWRTRDQTYISHLASYAREIHISGQGRRQIWIFSARKSNSPLKQCCELGDRFSGHWMRRWRLITSPLSSTGHLTFLVGFYHKQYVMGIQYLQTDKLNWSLKLLKLRLQRRYDT